ncbi:fibronectin type III domain-containing protein [Paenibacillus sp. PR3]|uniref:Fibronectin type III domain-containing protein n=2 Tax=Paenibacillus terricola TaxID=2763503 RepID=A0ABR8N044_9BACL|nr:fibronectin type III domain-containing protein [Paenibacillus terricola]
MTGYNWENNASNAGSDWLHSSDDYMCASTVSGCSLPGATVTKFHDISLANNSYSLVTLQMAGYAAADKNGAVSTSEAAPSSRWRSVVNSKGSAFSLTPDVTDNNVYMDEEVNFLVNKYGSAATATGIKGYSLDNEPDLWSNTHPRIHPAAVGAQELVDRSVSLSKAVKAVDPAAEIFGPASYGFYGFYALQDAPDWASLKGNYNWYLDYYLDKMKQASTTAGKRLLDVLDVHWYPEATGGGTRITFNGAGSLETQKARVQAPRSLWDSTYHETSWIADYFSSYLPIIPKLQSSINTYYPGTKLGITEYSYGGEGDISGGIAQADALGIFGKLGVYFASFWQLEPNAEYVNSAFKLYRNYDGNGSKFGDIHVKANTSDVENSSVYASVKDATNNELHLVVLNKNFDNAQNATIQIAGSQAYTSAAIYGFDGTGTALKQIGTVSNISGNQFTYSIPPLTAYHIVLKPGTSTVTAPSAPTGLTAAAGNAQAVLSWTASSGATSYNVKRATTSGGAYTTVATGVTGTTYTNTGLTNGTTYYYVVSAVNSAGESSNSAQASATPTAPVTVPSVPTGLTAAAGNAQATLSWTASSGATSYNVKRATTSGGAFTTVATGVTGTSYTNTGLTNGTTYYYVVSAVNSAGESSNSAQASATPTAPVTVPSVPTGLTATAGNAQATLTWTASSGATSYNVKRAMTSGGAYTTVATVVTGTSYTNTGLTNGTTYYYVVSAVNSAGESANSSQASATPAGSTTTPSSLVVQYKLSNSNANDNQIYATFNIKNTGTTAVNLNNLKLRYYLTKDTTSASLNYWVDYAQVGTSAVSGAFGTISPAKTTADTYLELSFSSAAGSIAAGGQTGEIQVRIAKSDWSNFSESNDYSFDGTKSSFADWNKVTLYNSGSLAWGIEP